MQNTGVCRRDTCDHIDISHDRKRGLRRRTCWLCDCKGFRGYPTWKRLWLEARWQWGWIEVRLGWKCGWCGFKPSACVCDEEEDV